MDNASCNHHINTVSTLFGLVAGVPSTGLAQSGRWDRNAVYAARVVALKKAIEQHPNDPGAIREKAMLYRMKYDLDRMRPYMEAALRFGPTHLDALDYIVDILRNTYTYGKVRPYKALLDRWECADSTPVIVKSKPRGPRR